MACQRYLFKGIAVECTALLVPGALGVLSAMWRLSCRMFQQALPPSLKEASIRSQQWQPKVIPTPTILLFQKRLPLIGAQHILPWQLHSCLLSPAPPGSKSREAEVLLVLKAVQYPDNVWPRLAKACNIYQRRERESFNASKTVTSQYENILEEGMRITRGCSLEKSIPAAVQSLLEGQHLNCLD